MSDLIDDGGDDGSGDEELDGLVGQIDDGGNDGLSDEELDRLVDQIAHEQDHIEVPADLVEEPDDPAPLRLGLAARIGALKVGERIKLALKGNRESRSILIRDSARLVRKFVLQNPRITEDEILAITKNRSSDGELIEAITKHRSWTQNYQIRLALVSHPKTSMGVGLRFVSSLQDRDLRIIAKSKNVPAAMSSAAKRIITRKNAPPTAGGGGH